MADLSTVEKAMVTQVAAVLFPSVSYLPGAKVASVPAGMTCKLFRGWPIAADLDADMLAGRAQVSVFPEPGMSRNTTRHLQQWQTPAAGVPTLTVAVDGADVTFGGTGGAGQVAGLAIGASPNPVAYAYRLLSGDDPADVAAAFEAMIEGSSAAGAVLTCPSASVAARVVADAEALRVTRMQQQGIRVSIWAPTPDARDTLAALVDAGLSDLRRFELSDGSWARVWFRMTATMDAPQKERLWRRDLGFLVEYATTIVEAFPAMLFGTLGVGVSVAAGGTPTAGDVIRQFGPASPQPEIYVDDDGNPILDAYGMPMGPVPE